MSHTSQTLGHSVADNMCRGEIDDACDIAQVYLQHAREHARIGDDLAIQRDLTFALNHVKRATGAYKDMAARLAQSVEEVAT